MLKAKLYKSSPAYLAIFLLALGCFYLLIALLKYTFVPSNELVSSIISAVTIISLTITGVMKKSEKSRPAISFSIFLPLIAIFFFIIKSIATNAEGGIYVVHTYITLICGMILFFSLVRNKSVKTRLGITYIVILSLISFIFLTGFLFSGLSQNTVVKSVISPNSAYLAEVIDNDQGALGGSTLVTVTQINKTLNLLIGELKKNPTRIYYGSWGEFDGMVIRWETDTTLYINGNKYEIK